jgi:hypothetical protein
MASWFTCWKDNRRKAKGKQLPIFQSVRPFGIKWGKEDAVFNGNLYGLIITTLTLLITVLLTMKQVEQSGLYVELIIRPLAVASLNKEQPRDVRADKPQVELPADEADEESPRLAAKPRQQMTQ